MTVNILRHSEVLKRPKNLFRQYLVNSANKQIPKRVQGDGLLGQDPTYNATVESEYVSILVEELFKCIVISVYEKS